MKTHQRLCLIDTAVPNGPDDVFWLRRGKEYTTSPEKDGKVCGFTRYWFWIEANIFGGAVPPDTDHDGHEHD